MDVNVDMHDWTLIKIVYEWEHGGHCRIFFRDRSSTDRSVEAHQVSTLSIPRKEEWGPSVSVNSVSYKRSKDHQEMNIEMQSGDVISVTAYSIQLCET